MSNILRRSLSLALALVMVLGMVPANVFAAETTSETTAVQDPQVAEVQAMIDALPSGVNAATEAEYVQKLGELQADLIEILESAEALTQEQGDQLDWTKYDNAWSIINAYYIGRKPMLVAVSTDQSNPSVYNDADGVIDGFTLKDWLGVTGTYGFKVVNSSTGAETSLTSYSQYYTENVTLSLNVVYSVQTKTSWRGSYSTVGYFIVQAPTVTVSVTTKNPVETVPMNGFYGPGDQKDALSAAIYNAVVQSTNHPGSYTIKVEDTGIISGWYELDSITFSKSNFKPGNTKNVKIIWAAQDGIPPMRSRLPLPLWNPAPPPPSLPRM